MKTSFAKYYFFSFCLWSFLILGHETQAASFTVKKVKGKQAVIEYTGPSMENGRTYKFSTPNESSNSTTNSRDRFLIIRELILSSLSSSTSGTSGGTINQFSILMGYGWNKENFEFAPLFGFETLDAGAGANTTFTLGVLADYNFKPNIPEYFSLFGGSLEATYEKTNGSSAASSPSTTQAFLSGFWKWFLFENSICLRMDMGYLYSKRSATTETTTSGFYGKGSLVIYF